MAERFPYAIVGCGGMGRRHLRGLARLMTSAHCNLELAAVCDLNAANANLLADEAAELVGRRPAVFSDIAAMARALPELRAADVTTEAGVHHRVATACLEAGLHVLCEKPLSITVRGCTHVIEAARRAGRTLSVAENFRRDPINRLIRALIDDGAIGAPRLMIESSIGGRDHIQITPWRHFKEQGTIVLDVGVHNADILRYYLGEVATISGEARLYERVRRNTKSPGPGGFYAQWSSAYPDTIEPTGEDALYAQLRFEAGAIGQWIQDHAGHGLPLRGRHVFGATGSLECPGDRNGRPIKLHRDDGTVIADQRILDYAPSYRLSPLAAELFGAERPWTYQLDFNETDSRILALEYHELGECIRTGAAPEVTGEEGRADVALVYAAFESGLLGRPVSLDEIVSGQTATYQQPIDQHLGLG